MRRKGKGGQGRVWVQSVSGPRDKARLREGQGAGRVQGQGTEGRAGLQDSILRFSRPENLKITFLQLFESIGAGRAGQGLGSERLGAGQHRARAKARGKGRAGCRAGAGHRGQGRVARFHFEVFKA